MRWQWLSEQVLCGSGDAKMSNKIFEKSGRWFEAGTDYHGYGLRKYLHRSEAVPCDLYQEIIWRSLMFPAPILLVFYMYLLTKT
jgi:hypothetical protein